MFDRDITTENSNKHIKHSKRKPVKGTARREYFDTLNDLLKTLDNCFLIDENKIKELSKIKLYAIRNTLTKKIMGQKLKTNNDLNNLELSIDRINEELQKRDK